jgi:hypothetical protein
VPSTTIRPWCSKAGPAAIGWQRFRELDKQYFGELVQALIDTRAASDLVDGARHLLAAVVRGALTELSFEIAQSTDRAQAHAQALTLIEHLIAALARPQTAAAG